MATIRALYRAPQLRNHGGSVSSRSEFWWAEEGPRPRRAQCVVGHAVRCVRDRLWRTQLFLGPTQRHARGDRGADFRGAPDRPSGVARSSCGTARELRIGILACFSVLEWRLSAGLFISSLGVCCGVKEGDRELGDAVGGLDLAGCSEA